jgi:crotonobetaine/carnitine-CoA ligase
MTSSFPAWTSNAGDTINDILRRAVSARADQPYLDFLGQIYTYGDVDREACRLANGLRALGIEKGHTVVSILDNSAEGVFLWLAINKLGAVAVPVNTAYKGSYLRHQVADASATVIIAESDYAERVAAIADSLPEFSKLVVRDVMPSLPGLKQTLIGFADLYSADVSDPNVPVAPGDLALLIYTGGTTGPSKGCMVSHNYACALAHQINLGCGRGPETISWSCLPMFHFNALANTLLGTLIKGGRCALYPRFSVSNFWSEIERTQANDAILLGSMVPMVLSAPPSDAEQRCRGQLKTLGSAPFPAKLQTAWKERFGSQYTVCPGFGLTECSLVTLISRDDSHTAKPDSSGKRNEWFDVRIVDDNDHELADGTPGEIIVRPRQPHVMFEGYWRRPEDTQKLQRNMWFHTGDIGKFDEDGFFYFVDRKKDYLRRRGENVSSFEVESAFRQHPAIEDVAVHAVPSALTEDDVKVTAILKAGITVTEEALCRWSIDQLPYFAVPRYIEFRASLPRSPVGRVLKYTLRDEGVTATTWDREKSDIQLKKR